MVSGPRRGRRAATMTRSVLSFVSLLALAACGEGASAGDPAAMNAAIRALMAKSEHTSPAIEVQHLLIAFQGSGIPKATRTKQEAEA